MHGCEKNRFATLHSRMLLQIKFAHTQQQKQQQAHTVATAEHGHHCVPRRPALRIRVRRPRLWQLGVRVQRADGEVVRPAAHTQAQELAPRQCDLVIRKQRYVGMTRTWAGSV